ncbi:MAG: type I DNA topoisomerase [Fretibacterium sp.]|nr:type I DNA topoisomerase [Fretibacterium sp.]
MSPASRNAPGGKKAASAEDVKPVKAAAAKATRKAAAKKTAAPKAASAKRTGTKRAAATGKTLVIVESPSKAATLSGILGKDYVVRASIGHIRDLPRSRMAIDIEHDFKPEYILVKGKAALKNELASLAQSASNVLLASDPDREGEAIAWHLADVLGLDTSEKCRVRFYEITAGAVRSAVQAPDFIDLNKVDAQQARRVLDRLVGYTLSPLLWKKIRYGLSAGRVQSVALNLICEREREIQRFVPDPYWVITVKASAVEDFRGAKRPPELQEDGRAYELKVDRLDGKSLMKGSLPLLINTEEKADEILAEVKGNPLRVSEFRMKESSRAAPAPFRTSTLQQEASRRLSMAPRRTMRVAQELYEGLNLPGRGHVGMITYMRTDSLRLSDEALTACRDYIAQNFSPRHLPAKPNHYAAPGRAQDAHEAIRPTDVSLTPASVKDILTPEQFRLYDLIWRRFVACQMSPAVTARASLRAEAGRAGLHQEGESLVFDGWSALWPLDLKGEQIAPAHEGEPLTPTSAEKEQRFTRPPARYSEATLIKTLEENGVGRPSTYATIAGTLDVRGYVEKNDEKRFCPTSLGMTVDDFLMKYFNRKDLSSIVDAGFTAQMEKELDEVEEAQRRWLDVVREFWGEFSHTVEEAQGASRVPLPEPEPIGEDCPECGKPLVKKRGRFGEFIACSGYPDCRYTRAILATVGVKCPKCGETHGGEVVRRKSKKGRTFYSCSRYPDCDYISWNQPVGERCPECGAELFRRGRTRFCAQCGYKAQDEAADD